MKLASFNSLIKFIVIPSLAIIFYIYGELLFQEVKAVPNNPLNPQKKLTTLGMLIGRNGTPEEFGYMTMPLKVFNENSLLPWQKFRLKKWDHFDVVSDEIAFTVSVADLYYGGEIRLGCFDYKTRDYKSFSKSLLPFSVPRLSADSFRFLNESDADVSFTSDDFTIKVENFGNKVSDKYFTRTISVTAKPIDLTLKLEMKTPADQESMTAIIPLTDEKQHFFYTIKMPNIQVEGNLKVGNKEYQITSENAGGFIDWGRGVWTYNTYWVFARGQGFLENGKRFSLNFASGYGDAGSSQATEDSFFIDRFLYKLNVVEPKFDDNNLMNPWTFNTLPNEKKDFQECEIIFAPHYQTVKSLNLIIGQSEMRVVYGQYSGWVTDKNNKKYNFEGLNGSVEVFKTKW